MALRIVSMLTLTTPLYGLAAPPAPDPQVMALVQQVEALQVDHALALTQQQAQALLPILQSGRTQLQALQSQRQASDPALVAALTQAVADLQSTGTISATTTQALNAARPQPPASGGDLRSTWQQVQQVLTAAQVQALGAVQLGVPGGGPGGPGGGPGPGHEGGGAGHQFRMMHVFLSDSFVSLVQARAG